MSRLAVPLLVAWLIVVPWSSYAQPGVSVGHPGTATPQLAKKPSEATTPRKAELLASWYSKASLLREGTWKRSKGRMANGRMFDEREYTCATWLYPLGTALVVSYAGRSVRVQNTDRISRRFAQSRIDLSAAAFDRLADRGKGLIKVKVRRAE